MKVEIIKILNEAGHGFVQKIKGQVPHVTGQTANSLEFKTSYEHDAYRLQILGRPFFMTVETGRKPKGDKPSPEMVKNIQKWMDAKGIEGKAYGMARYINQHGTKLYRDGGKKDVVSNVLNETAIGHLSQEILTLLAKEILE